MLSIPNMKKQNKSQKSKINGLHLWSIKTTPSCGGNLWITTASHDMIGAIKKAKAFLRAEHGRNTNVKVAGVENHGTLDA